VHSGDVGGKSVGKKGYAPVVKGYVPAVPAAPASEEDGYKAAAPAKKHHKVHHNGDGKGTGRLPEILKALEDNNLVADASLFERAGLAEALDDPKVPFTFFAPTGEVTNRTLASVGFGTGNDVADDDLLRTVLPYHVIIGEVVTSADLRDDAVVETALPLENSVCGVNTVQLKLKNEVVPMVVGGADTAGSIVNVDIAVTNGVIHAIDMVLLPCPLAS